MCHSSVRNSSKDDLIVVFCPSTKHKRSERRNGDLNERCLLRFPGAFSSVSRGWNVFACVCCCWIEKGSMSSTNLHFFFFLLFFHPHQNSWNAQVCERNIHTWAVLLFELGCCRNYFSVFLLILSPPWASQSTKKKFHHFASSVTLTFLCVCVSLCVLLARRDQVVLVNHFQRCVCGQRVFVVLWLIPIYIFCYFLLR